MMTTQRKETGRGPRALWSSERGGVAMYLGFSMLFILPMMAGAISVSQIYTLNTELQQAADASALAAATELNGTEAGCDAARAAAQNAVYNFQSFANDDGGAEAKLSSIMLLTALPPAPLTDFERLGIVGRYADYEVAENKCEDARYVRVVTELREQVSYPMRAYLIMTGPYLEVSDVTSDAGARMITASAAVAGHVTVACKTMPLMMCNPLEVAPGCGGDPDMLIGTNPSPPGDISLKTFYKNNPQWHRRLTRIKWIGPNAGLAPGVFGLLEPFFSDKKAVPGIVEEFAIVDPPICVELNSPLVDVKTGQAQAVVNGLNVRFDIYRANVNKYKNDSKFRPGPNVTKGALGNKCDPNEVEDLGLLDEPPPAKKLPRDKCFKNFDDAACFTPGPDPVNDQFHARMGDGKWNIARYFQVNHPKEYADLFVEADGTTLVGTDDVDLNVFLRSIRDTLGNTDYDDSPSNPKCGATCDVDIDNPPSRFAVYNWELDGEELFDPRIPGEDTELLMADGQWLPQEEGQRPMAGDQCSNQGAELRQRRNIFIAVVNCCQQMEALSQGDRIVRVDEILEAFLTEPAAANASGGADMGAIYIEAVKVLEPGASDTVVLRDYVQLY